MTRWTRRLLVASTILVGGIALSPLAAQAHGRIGFHPAIVVGGYLGGPFYGIGYAYGSGYPFCSFGPYWGPCYGPYGPYVPYASNGLEIGAAAAAGVGAVDLNVKPGAAEVWVDGRFVAEAHDLGASPGFLWLKDGPHHLVVYEAGYRSFDEDIFVHQGQKLDLKVRLEEGDSRPPGTRPGANADQAR